MTLTMPSNFVALDEQEMKAIDGGWIIPVIKIGAFIGGAYAAGYAIGATAAAVKNWFS